MIIKGIILYVIAGILVALFVYFTDGNPRINKSRVFTNRELVYIMAIWPVFLVATIFIAIGLGIELVRDEMAKGNDRRKRK